MSRSNRNEGKAWTHNKGTRRYFSGLFVLERRERRQKQREKDRKEIKQETE